MDRFVATYEVKYPKAVDCLARDRETLLAFYNFRLRYADADGMNA